MQYLVFDVTPSELPLVVRQPADELLRYGPESRAAILVARATRRDANGQLHPRYATPRSVDKGFVQTFDKEDTWLHR
jgi:hypothetical protein